MARLRTWAGAGALVGAAFSAWAWHAGGAGPGDGLFLVSLPWSLPVAVAWGAAADASGGQGPALGRLFFHAMPVAAGAGWGGLAGLLRAALGPRALRRDLAAARARARDT